MKAVRIHGYGGPEVLKYEDIPVPAPKPNEVPVRVRLRFKSSRCGGEIRGKIAAKRMTKAQRIARAKKAAKTSAEVRRAKAKKAATQRGTPGNG